MAPPRTMLMMFRVTVPVFVIVTDCDPDDPLTGTLPKDKLVAENETFAGPPVPVPLNAMVCGEPSAESVIVIVAGSEPSAVGPKCPWMEQFAPPASEDPQLLAKS